MWKKWFGDVFRNNEPHIQIQHLRKPHKTYADWLFVIVSSTEVSDLG